MFFQQFCNIETDWKIQLDSKITSLCTSFASGKSKKNISWLVYIISNFFWRNLKGEIISILRSWFLGKRFILQDMLNWILNCKPWVGGRHLGNDFEPCKTSPASRVLLLLNLIFLRSFATMNFHTFFTWFQSHLHHSWSWSFNLKMYTSNNVNLKRRVPIVAWA